MIIDKKFSIDTYKITWCVSKENSGQRLDQYIQKFFSSFSREEIKRRIAQKEIIITNRPSSLRPSVKVYENDIIIMTMAKGTTEDEYWRGEKVALVEAPTTIFEDDDLLVISKPPYMTTHPTGRHIYYCATVYYENKYNKTIHSIHRLDRETSGILLLAKNSQTAKKLTPLFEQHKVKKCYFFISKTTTQIENGEFTASERMESSEEGQKRVFIQHYPENSKQGKSAKTIFKLIYKEDEYYIGLAFPKTGRQHQIRVHAYAHKLPLLGDKLYLGSYKTFQRFKDGLATEDDYDFMEIPRHALHAMAISFEYKNEKKIFIDNLPEDLSQWIKTSTKFSLEEFYRSLPAILENYL